MGNKRIIFEDMVILSDKLELLYLKIQATFGKPKKTKRKYTKKKREVLLTAKELVYGI